MHEPSAVPALLVWHLGRRGGGPRYTLELARALAADGRVQVHLAVSKQSELLAASRSLGLPLLEVDTYRDALSALRAVPRIPAVARRMADYVKDANIQFCLCGMAHLWNGWLVPAMQQAGAKNILVVHDAQPHPGENYLLRRTLMRRDIRQADAVITLTEAVRQQVLAQSRLRASQSFVVPMGSFGYGGEAVHRNQPRQLPRDRPVRLLFFGRLRPYKGLDQLLAAFSILRQGNHNVELDIVGSGSLGELKVPDGVRVNNRWIEEDEIPGIFAQADMTVLPYTEASQSGLLPIAAEFAIPSVVTPVGGLVEQLGGAGTVADDASAREIASAVSRLLDPQVYHAASIAALEQAGAGTWKTSAGKIRDIVSMMQNKI